MVSVLLDTNIYGRIIKDRKYGEKIAESILRDTNFTVHNFKIIRKELRRAPNILHLYDTITTNKLIQVTDQIKKIADFYFKIYKKKGGHQKKSNNFMNDLKIVACASIKGFDLIFSDDEKTMKSKIAIESYKEINLKYGYRTPTFYNYSDLRRKYA